MHFVDDVEAMHSLEKNCSKLQKKSSGVLSFQNFLVKLLSLTNDSEMETEMTELQLQALGDFLASSTASTLTMRICEKSGNLEISAKQDFSGQFSFFKPQKGNLSEENEPWRYLVFSYNPAIRDFDCLDQQTNLIKNTIRHFTNFLSPMKSQLDVSDQRSLAIEEVGRKLHDLESSVETLHLLSHKLPTPVKLKAHPFVESLLEMQPSEMKNAICSEQPAVPIAEIERTVVGWIVDCQKVTRISAMELYEFFDLSQEVSFWDSYERYLLELDARLRQPDVSVSIQVLQHYKRFQTAAALSSETGIKAAYEFASSRASALRDLPIQEISEISSINEIPKVATSVFSALNRKLQSINGSLSHLEVIYQAASLISKEMSRHVIRLLNSMSDLKLLILSAFTDCLIEWDFSHKEFLSNLREEAKRHTGRYSVDTTRPCDHSLLLDALSSFCLILAEHTCYLEALDEFLKDGSSPLTDQVKRSISQAKKVFSDATQVLHAVDVPDIVAKVKEVSTRWIGCCKIFEDWFLEVIGRGLDSRNGAFQLLQFLRHYQNLLEGTRLGSLLGRHRDRLRTEIIYEVELLKKKLSTIDFDPRKFLIARDLVDCCIGWHEFILMSATQLSIFYGAEWQSEGDDFMCLHQDLECLALKFNVKARLEEAIKFLPRINGPVLLLDLANAFPEFKISFDRAESELIFSNIEIVSGRGFSLPIPFANWILDYKRVRMFAKVVDEAISNFVACKAALASHFPWVACLEPLLKRLVHVARKGARLLWELCLVFDPQSPSNSRYSRFATDLQFLVETFCRDSKEIAHLDQKIIEQCCRDFTMLPQAQLQLEKFFPRYKLSPAVLMWNEKIAVAAFEKLKTDTIIKKSMVKLMVKNSLIVIDVEEFQLQERILSSLDGLCFSEIIALYTESPISLLNVLWEKFPSEILKLVSSHFERSLQSQHTIMKILEQFNSLLSLSEGSLLIQNDLLQEARFLSECEEKLRQLSSAKLIDCNCISLDVSAVQKLFPKFFESLGLMKEALEEKISSHVSDFLQLIGSIVPSDCVFSDWLLLNDRNCDRKLLKSRYNNLCESSTEIKSQRLKEKLLYEWKLHEERLLELEDRFHAEESVLIAESMCLFSSCISNKKALQCDFDVIRLLRLDSVMADHIDDLAFKKFELQLSQLGTISSCSAFLPLIEVKSFLEESVIFAAEFQKALSLILQLKLATESLLNSLSVPISSFNLLSIDLIEVAAAFTRPASITACEEFALWADHLQKDFPLIGEILSLPSEAATCKKEICAIFDLPKISLLKSIPAYSIFNPSNYESRVTKVRQALEFWNGETVLRESIESIQEFCDQAISFKREDENLIGVLQSLSFSLVSHLSTLETMRCAMYIRNIESKRSGCEETLLSILKVVDNVSDMLKQQQSLEQFLFSGDFIPAELRNRTNNTFQSSIELLFSCSSLLQLACSNALLDSACRVLDCLAESRNILQKFLAMQRDLFPRFFFIGNDELLQFFGTPLSDQSLNKCVCKLFPSIFQLCFDESHQIIAVIANSKETLKLNQPVAIKEVGDRTKICQNLQLAISDSLRKSFFALLPVVDASFKARSVEFIHSLVAFPFQVCQLALQVCCSEVMENVTNYCELFEFISTLLQSLASFSEENALYRNLEFELIYKLNELNFLRDATSELARQQRRNFSMQYLTLGNEVLAKIGAFEIKYAFEFLGCYERIVSTEFVSHLHKAMAVALGAGYGCKLFGPAGTGKTESIKALGFSLGKNVIVFNCGKSFDLAAIRNILVGIARIGSWCCFDEINRLDEANISALSDTIIDFQRALKAPGTSISIAGKIVSVEPGAAVFVTLNPSYIGRVRLPPSFDSLFRGFAVGKPITFEILQTILCVLGLENSRDLAITLGNVFYAASILLEKAKHYDFGLRAIKSVIRSLKLEPKSLPTKVALKGAIERCILPRLKSADVSIFSEIVQRVFCDQSSDFKAESSKSVEIVRLLECSFGVILYGSNYFVRERALLEAAEMSPARPKFFYINANLFNERELCGGYYESVSGNWVDGLIAALFRKISQDPFSNYWILFTGADLHSDWLESLNSVLDDNQFLSLASGERISLPCNCRLIFDSDSIEKITPASVSRCSLVYFEESLVIDEQIRNLYKQSKSSAITEYQFYKNIENLIRLFKAESYLDVEQLIQPLKWSSESCSNQFNSFHEVFEAFLLSDLNLLFVLSLFNPSHLIQNTSMPCDFLSISFSSCADYKLIIQFLEKNLKKVVRSLGKAELAPVKPFPLVIFCLGVDQTSSSSSFLSSLCHAGGYWNNNQWISISSQVKFVVTGNFKKFQSSSSFVICDVDKLERGCSSSKCLSLIEPISSTTENIFIESTVHKIAQNLKDSRCLLLIGNEGNGKSFSVKKACKLTEHRLIEPATPEPFDSTLVCEALRKQIFSFCSVAQPIVITANLNRSRSACFLWGQFLYPESLFDFLFRGERFKESEAVLKKFLSESVRVIFKFNASAATVRAGFEHFFEICSVIEVPILSRLETEDYFKRQCAADPLCLLSSFTFESNCQVTRAVSLFNNFYKRFLNEKLQEHHYRVGGRKRIDQFTASVASSADFIRVEKERLTEKKAQCNSTLQQIVFRQTLIDSESENLKSLKTSLSISREKVSSSMKMISDRLCGIEPLVTQAKLLVGEIKKSHLNELRSLNSPPTLVKQTLEAVCVLLGVSHGGGWREILTVVRKDDFITSVLAFDPEKIFLDPSVVDRLKLIFLDGSSVDDVLFSSKACGPLAQWVQAQIQFSIVNRDVKSLRDKITSLEGQDRRLEGQIIEAESNLNVLQQELNSSKEEFTDLTTQISSLTAEIEKASYACSKAQILLSSLSAEIDRWCVEKDADETRERIFSELASSVTASLLLELPSLKTEESSLTFDEIRLLECCEFNWEDFNLLKHAVSLDETLFVCDDSPDNRVQSLLSKYFSLSDKRSIRTVSMSNPAWTTEITDCLSFGCVTFLTDLEKCCKTWFLEYFLQQLSVSVSAIQLPITVLPNGDVAEQSIQSGFRLFLFSKVSIKALEFSSLIKKRAISIDMTKNFSQSCKQIILNLFVNHFQPDLLHRRNSALSRLHELSWSISKAEKTLLLAIEDSSLSDDQLIEHLQQLKNQAERLQTEKLQIKDAISDIEEERLQHQHMMEKVYSLFSQYSNCFPFSSMISILERFLKRGYSNEQLVDFLTRDFSLRFPTKEEKKLCASAESLNFAVANYRCTIAVVEESDAEAVLQLSLSHSAKAVSFSDYVNFNSFAKIAKSGVWILREAHLSFDSIEPFIKDFLLCSLDNLSVVLTFSARNENLRTIAKRFYPLSRDCIVVDANFTADPNDCPNYSSGSFARRFHHLLRSSSKNFCSGFRVSFLDLQYSEEITINCPLSMHPFLVEHFVYQTNSDAFIDKYLISKISLKAQSSSDSPHIPLHQNRLFELPNTEESPWQSLIPQSTIDLSMVSFHSAYGAVVHENLSLRVDLSQCFPLLTLNCKNNQKSIVFSNSKDAAFLRKVPKFLSIANYFSCDLYEPILVKEKSGVILTLLDRDEFL